MDIYTRYKVTCEKREKSIKDKLLNKKKVFEIWAPYILNNFSDKINTDVYKILSITPTDETIEVFG
jgi:hypothetical protein